MLIDALLLPNLLSNLSGGFKRNKIQSLLQISGQYIDFVHNKALSIPELYNGLNSVAMRIPIFAVPMPNLSKRLR
jgi:hypothetical protein